MTVGTIIGSFDVTTLVFSTFVLFFIGLVFYLRREDRREGYPLETDTGGKLEEPGGVWHPTPKAFRLPGGDLIYKPDTKRDPETHNLKRLAVWPGAPSEPVGDAMKSGVGPGSHAQRDNVPDVTHEGQVKIVPMRVLPEFSVAKGDPDPRGFDVIGADGQSGGKINEIWMDRAEALVRYYEIALADGRKVLLPYAFANVKGKAKQVRVEAILGKHFVDVPGHANPDQVTRLEEDQISAYYAAGTLYATSDRAEPWI